MVGNPLISRINYLDPRGLQENKDTPELVMTWNTMPAGSPIVRRTFWIHNSSPFNIVVEWKIMKEVEEKEKESNEEENDGEEKEENGGEIVEENEAKQVNTKPIEEQVKDTEEIKTEKKQGENDEEKEGGEEEEGEKEIVDMNEESIPKLHNLCRVIFIVQENKKNTLHCMLVPERNGENWSVRVCLLLYVITIYT